MGTIGDKLIGLGWDSLDGVSYHSKFTSRDGMIWDLVFEEGRNSSITATNIRAVNITQPANNVDDIYNFLNNLSNPVKDYNSGFYK